MLHAACTAGAHYSSAHPDWGPGFNKVTGSEGTATLFYLLYSRVSFLWKLSVKVSWWDYSQISSCHPSEVFSTHRLSVPSINKRLSWRHAKLCFKKTCISRCQRKRPRVQFILALALSIPCRLSTEGAPHVELGRQRVQQQILSYQEVLTLDTVGLSEKYSQPIKVIQVHKA